MNAEPELDSKLKSLLAQLGLNSVAVERHARSITGRPHVFLHDMLRVGCDLAQGGPFVITNADIILSITPEFLAFIGQEVSRKGFVLARRIDIAAPDERKGTPWYSGFDFFAVHPDAIRNLTDIGLIFGAPWWDLYFPAELGLTNCKPREIKDPIAFHLIHDERWEPELWRKLGQRFLHTTQARLDQSADGQTATIFRTLLHRAILRRTSNPLSDLVYAARRRLVSKYAAEEPEKMLVRVSQATIDFVAHYSSPLRVL